MTGQADTESSMNMARRWFTAGRAGNIALVGNPSERTSEPMVARLDLKRRIQERLAGFPDLTTAEDWFSGDENIVIRLVWRGPYQEPIWGRQGNQQAGRVPPFCLLAPRKRDKAAEILTIQDQFALLKQIGISPPEGLSGVARARRLCVAQRRR